MTTATFLNLFIVTFYVAIDFSSVLIISSSKDEKGDMLYNTTTIILLVEVLKFVISYIAAVREGKAHELRSITLMTFLPFSVPAILYGINNNIYLYVLTQISPPVFQILCNLRVFWTAFIFQFFLGRQITMKQWGACLLLVLGAIMTQEQSFSDGSIDLQQFMSAALIITLIYTFISTIAGVSCEVLLKSNLSVNCSNCLLYSYGVLFNSLGLIFQSSGSDGDYFRGWGLPSTWVIAALMVCNGLVTSRVMRRFDSIVKIFLVTLSNFFVYMYTVHVEGTGLSFTFLVAFCMVSFGAYSYNTAGSAKIEKAKTIEFSSLPAEDRDEATKAQQ